MMSYYYHHYHIYHQTPTANNTSNADNENTDFVDKSEEFHVYDHCRPIPEDTKPPSRRPSFGNHNDNNNNLTPAVAKVKEVYHIYRSGSGASSPSCNLPHYGSTSKPYNPYSRYQECYGSNRSSNGVRLLKFGDTLTEKSIENELENNDKVESNENKTNDVENCEQQDEIIPISLGEISECEEEEEDKDRISRLFYLQLYSGTLDTEKYERDENYRNKIKQLYLRRRKSEKDLGKYNHKITLEKNVSENAPTQEVKRPFLSNLPSANFFNSLSWMNFSNFFTDSTTNMQRELKKGRLGKREDHERTSVGDRLSYRAQKTNESKNGTNRNAHRDDDRNRVPTESPDSYDLSISMETKILSSGSSSKDRNKLVPAFRQSYLRNSNQYQDETQMGTGKPAKFLRNSRLGSSVSSRKSSYSNKSLEPVLNTRMKNLSNFSFRYKDNEHERVVVQRSHTCRFRDLFCTWPLYIGVTIAMSILVLVVLLFSNPKSFTSYYETVYLPDEHQASKPKISLCLSMPFDEEKLRSNGISTTLASFLLYSLSPFLPNPEILDNPELLADLSTQYRRFMSRRKRLSRLPRNAHGLRKVLKTLAPSCEEVISGCQTGTKAIIRGSDCCRFIFNGGRLVFGPQGLCLVGGDFARRSIQPGFPLASPGSIAQLTIVINNTKINTVAVDHRVIPWEPTQSRGALIGAIVNDREEVAYRNIQRDFSIQPGRTLSVDVVKKAKDNTSPMIFNNCASKPFNKTGVFMASNSLYSHKGCRASVVQLISEKSVNCSLISLPKVNRTLPTCGPLEGLALMYILREQGSLVTLNSTLLERFETTLGKHCPEECYLQYFEPIVRSDIATDPQTARQFHSHNSRGLSIVKFNYKASEFILTEMFVPRSTTFLYNFGSLCGGVSIVFWFLYLLKRLCKRQKRMFFIKTPAT